MDSAKKINPKQEIEGWNFRAQLTRLRHGRSVPTAFDSHQYRLYGKWQDIMKVIRAASLMNQVAVFVARDWFSCLPYPAGYSREDLTTGRHGGPIEGVSLDSDAST